MTPTQLANSKGAVAAAEARRPAGPVFSVRSSSSYGTARGDIIRDELETGLNLRGVFRRWARRPIALELVDVTIADSEQGGVGIKEMEFDAAARGERPDFLVSDIRLVEAERRRLFVRVRQPSVKQGAARELLELVFWFGAGKRRLGVDTLARTGLGAPAIC
jgi:hypothetical protein